MFLYQALELVLQLLDLISCICFQHFYLLLKVFDFFLQLFDFRLEFALFIGGICELLLDLLLQLSNLSLELLHFPALFL
jgi:hypothetical protein